MDIMIHVANVLYLLSYLMRDILWLRAFTVIAAVCLVSYFFFRPDPLMPAIYWNLLFTSLNIYWIWRLLLERRPVRLSEEEHRLHQLAFRSLTPRELLNLVKLGRWIDLAPQECLVEEGKALDRLHVIYSGKACIELEGKSVAELHEGQFIGGISFITEKAAPANIVALEPIRCISWPISKLKEYLKVKQEVRSAFQMILGRDLTSRLRASWARQRDDQPFN